LLGTTIAATPLVYLVVRAREAGWSAAVETLAHPTTLPLLARSLGLATVVTVASVFIGVAAAWLVVGARFPGRGLFAVVAPLPLAVPSYVAAYAWVSAFPGMEGFWSAALVLTLCCYPYVYLPVAAALARADPGIDEVSRSLGAGEWRTFTRLKLPYLRPAIASGALLVSLYVVSDFGAVSVLRVTTFTRAIFTSFDLGFDRVTAVVLSTVLIAVTTVLVLGEALIRGRHHNGLTPVQRNVRRARLGSGAVPAGMFMITLVTLAVAIPAASIGYWTVRGAARSVPWPDIVEAARGSLLVSAAGAGLTVLLALPIGVLAARHRGTLPTLLERVTWMSHALPGVVVGLSLVFLSVNVVYPLYQSTSMLAVGYAVLFLPLAVGAIRVAASHSPLILEETARALGKRPSAVFATVTLPLAGPGVAAVGVPDVHEGATGDAVAPPDRVGHLGYVAVVTDHRRRVCLGRTVRGRVGAAGRRTDVCTQPPHRGPRQCWLMNRVGT
jgi:iron(III) transport system permease protein